MRQNKLIIFVGVILILGIFSGGYFLIRTPASTQKSFLTDTSQSTLTYQNQYLSVNYPQTWYIEKGMTSSSSVSLVSRAFDAHDDATPFAGLLIGSYTPDEYIAKTGFSAPLYNKNAILQSIRNQDMQAFVDSTNYSCKLYPIVTTCQHAHTARVENINGTTGYILVVVQNSDPYMVHTIKGFFLSGGRLVEVTANISEKAQHLETPTSTDDPIDIIKNTEFGKIIMSLRLK